LRPVLDPQTGERRALLGGESGVELADLLLQPQTAERLVDADALQRGVRGRVLKQ
jgi:hypothetical protein